VAFDAGPGEQVFQRHGDGFGDSPLELFFPLRRAWTFFSRFRLRFVGGEQLAGFRAGLASGFAEFVNQVLELGAFLLLCRDHFYQREYYWALLGDGNLDGRDGNRAAFLRGRVGHTLQRARNRYPE